MLTRIRNSILVKSPKVKIIRTNSTLSICKILKREGFIENYEECDKVFISENECYNRLILLTLKYKGVKQKPYITSIKAISKPGIKIYVNNKNIPKVLGGIGIAILSTSRGLLTDREAREQKIGGEVLFYVW